MTESISTTWASPPQRVDGVVVAVRRPHERHEVGHEQRVDDRVEPLRCDSPIVELDALGAERDRPLGPASSSIAAHASIVRRRSSTAQHDRARRVEAADPLEPVLDLAAPLAVDDRDEVEHARGHEPASSA